MRPRLGLILMVLCISMFFGMLVTIASFAAMMLGIGMPLGFCMAGVFMLFSSRLGSTAPQYPSAGDNSCRQNHGNGDPLLSGEIESVLVEIHFHDVLLRTAGDCR